MFGNRIGWALSAVIWAGAFLLLWFVNHLGTAVTPPSWIGEKAAQWTFKLPVDPRTVATWMDQPGDATPLYQQAIKYYEENRNAFYAYTEVEGLHQKAPERAVVERGLDLLIQASRIRDGSLFKTTPEKLITYDLEYPELSVLGLTYKAAALRTAAYYNSENNPEKANQIYKAVFTLGARMYEERLVFKEWWYARELMANGGGFLQKNSKDGDLAERCRAFEAQILPFYGKFVQPLQSAIVENMRPEIADCIPMALRGGDVMWRTEATLALGRCKYASVLQPDINAAIATLDQLVNDPDPRVRLAAKLARDLKIEEWRKIH